MVGGGFEGGGGGGSGWFVSTALLWGLRVVGGCGGLFCLLWIAPRVWSMGPYHLYETLPC